METLGYLGGILLGLCGLPQAIHSVRTGKAEDVNWLFLVMWLLGEVLMLIYGYFALDKDGPVLFNCAFNVIMILTIIGVKLK